MSASSRRFAFVFYATNPTYGKAALVCLAALRELGTPEDVDYVLLYTSLPTELLGQLSRAGIRTRQVEPLPKVRHRYFRDCLIKLKAFHLIEYERVLYLDVDALPLARLDHLFHEPLEASLAMPPAYWVTSKKIRTSCFMLIKPSEELWRRLRAHFPTAQKQGIADMDIVNLEFGEEIQALPATYACLDSEWIRLNGPFYFNPPDIARSEIKLVHFTHLGKPWFYRPAWMRHLLAQPHPQLAEVWSRWWRLSDQVSHGKPILAAWKRTLLFLTRFYRHRIGPGR